MKKNNQLLHATKMHTLATWGGFTD